MSTCNAQAYEMMPKVWEAICCIDWARLKLLCPWHSFWPQRYASWNSKHWRRGLPPDVTLDVAIIKIHKSDLIPRFHCCERRRCSPDQRQGSRTSGVAPCNAVWGWSGRDRRCPDRRIAGSTWTRRWHGSWRQTPRRRPRCSRSWSSTESRTAAVAGRLCHSEDCNTGKRDSDTNSAI